jgi:hypothetical protein
LTTTFLIIRISPVAAANDRPTLYAPGDNVLELDVNTFDRAVYQKVGYKLIYSPF